MNWVAGLLAFLLVVTPAGAQTYRWVDEKGVVHYSQGVHSVPEQFRVGAVLPPEQRDAALQILKALKDLQPFAVPTISLGEYSVRLQRINGTVSRALSTIDAGPVRSALASAHGHYNAAERVLRSTFVTTPTMNLRSILVPIGDTCVPVAQLLLERLDTGKTLRSERGFSQDALAAIFQCASSAIAEAEEVLTLTSSKEPGAAPR